MNNNMNKSIINKITIKELTRVINSLEEEFDAGTNISDRIFSNIRQELEETHSATLSNINNNEENNFMNNKIIEAEKEIATWIENGYVSKYTPSELATEKIRKEVIEQYLKEHSTELTLLNNIHQTVISNHIIKSGLANTMIENGRKGINFGIIELSSRLSPILTFPDASKYFTTTIIPYSKESRMILGETPMKKTVSQEAAIESAKNLAKKFNIKYVLAETSSAPRRDIVKSKRKPEIYICSLKNDIIGTKHYDIDVPTRQEFDSCVREIMYRELIEMYHE